jgi:hypothetical protein
MCPPLLLVPLLASLLGALPPAGPLASGSSLPPRSSIEEPDEEPEEERIREAWSYLRPAEKRDVIEWLRVECEGLGTLQRGLIDFILNSQAEDPGFSPEDQPPPFYDPAEHAPGQAARKRVAEGHRLALKTRLQILGEPDPTRLRSAWRYDWGSRELRRDADLDQPDRIFENALVGHPPDLDLARELVLRQLDEGEQREALAALGHAYTDRNGKVFPGLTLYDAWNSGNTIEMPDVDNLGIIHDIDDQWRKWVSPVPASKHDALYERVGEIFLDANRYRALREALADCYLIGEPAPRAGYGVNYSRFHALWEKHGSDPASLVKKLPDTRRWKRFLEKLIRDLARDEKLWQRGANRQAILATNGRAVRSTLLRILTEYGAFERRSLPEEVDREGGQEGKEGG